MVTRVLIDGNNNKVEFRDSSGNLTFDQDSFYLRYNTETLLNSKLIYNELLPIPVPCDNTYTALTGISSVVAMANQGGHPVGNVQISKYSTKVWDSNTVVADDPSNVFVITPSIFGGGITQDFQLNGCFLIATATGKISGRTYSIFMRARIAKVMLPGGPYYSFPDPQTTVMYYKARYTYNWYGPTDLNILNLPKEAFGYSVIPEPFILEINDPPSGVKWGTSNTVPATDGVINVSWYSSQKYFNTVMSL
jgi:hypothetical protein